MTDPQTLPQLFLSAVDRFSTKGAALRHKSDGLWHDITHQTLARRVHHVAVGLRELGVSAGDRVAILSHNRPEWAVADLACLSIGGVDVAIYPTLPAPQVAYLLSDSGVMAAIVSDKEQYDKVAAARRNLSALRHVIAFDELAPDADAMPFAELEAVGANAVARYPDYRALATAIEPDTLATLIYTSGTTGDPKGVMLTHRNFVSNVLSVLSILPLGPEDSCLSLLPLSHSFERMAGYYTMLYAGATINYAENIQAFADNLLEIQPTVMLSVPRLYEKIYARVLDSALSGGTVKSRVFFWARRTGLEWTQRTLNGSHISPGLKLRRRIADRLVFSKLRTRTGGRLRYFVSGGAPLSPDISEFFFAAGLPILEGYGLSETSPVISVNPFTALRIGTVGPPIPGVEARLTEEGEIIVRGPNVMQGYYNKPEATAEAIDEEGWFHTGDVGEIDDAGYLRITDRIKDLIVTAGGKKIAPQPIENRIKTSPFVRNAVMIGDKRKFAILLVVPEPGPCRKWAAERNLTADSPDALYALPDVVAKIEREVMVHLRDLARFEMPKKIVVLPDDFTEERGEITPTLKVKRRVIEKHYGTQIEAAYEG